MANREEKVGGEPLSPAAQLFHAPSLNCYVVAMMGSKTRLNPTVIKEGLSQTLLRHPRFSSKLVCRGREMKWTPTTVDLEYHVKVPEIDTKNIDMPDRFVEDYVSNFTKTPLDLSKPLWELHLLNIKTSDAEGVGIFRIHHSMGDGASLMSLLLACTRKASDPDALPTLPSHKKAGSARSGLFWWPFLALWWWLSLICNTLLDMTVFILTIMFIKDTESPLKGPPGVEFTTKRFVHRTVSMDDVKLVKNALHATVNDVLLGVTQAGIARCLNRIYFQAGTSGNGGAPNQKRNNNMLETIRLRAAILVNVRSSAGIQELADMMAKKSKVKWGNCIGYVLLPFPLKLQEDHLEYVRQAKATIDRKKHSFEAVCSFGCAQLALKLFGPKIAAPITHKVLCHTTTAFSNVVGPTEEICFYGHPVAYISPSVYGHPQALTIHIQSYVNKLTFSLAIDPSVIPDPHLLCDDFELSLKLMRDAVKKNLIADAV